MTLHQSLVHAATSYDRRQQKKRHYNYHALPLMLQAIDRAEEQIKAGATIRAALISQFCGRLLDVFLKAAGEPPSTREECR